MARLVDEVYEKHCGSAQDREDEDDRSPPSRSRPAGPAVTYQAQRLGYTSWGGINDGSAGHNRNLNNAIRSCRQAKERDPDSAYRVIELIGNREGSTVYSC